MNPSRLWTPVKAGEECISQLPTTIMQALTKNLSWLMLLFWVPMKDQWKTSDLAVNTKCYPTSIDYINPEIEETPAHALFPLNTASIKRVDIYLFFVKVISVVVILFFTNRKQQVYTSRGKCGWTRKQKDRASFVVKQPPHFNSRETVQGI